MLCDYKASQCISVANLDQMECRLITLEADGLFDQILLTYIFQHCMAIGMQKSDKVLRSYSPASHGQKVKIITTAEGYVILINFCILIHFRPIDELFNCCVSPSLGPIG